MLEIRNGADLAVEAVEYARGLDDFAADNLEHLVAAHDVIVGEEYQSHPAAAQLADDFIVGVCGQLRRNCSGRRTRFRVGGARGTLSPRSPGFSRRFSIRGKNCVDHGLKRGEAPPILLRGGLLVCATAQLELDSNQLFQKRLASRFGGFDQEVFDQGPRAVLPGPFETVGDVVDPGPIGRRAFSHWNLSGFARLSTVWYIPLLINSSRRTSSICGGFSIADARPSVLCNRALRRSRDWCSPRVSRARSGVAPGQRVPPSGVRAPR